MGFKPYLKDQLVSLSALTLLVWSYDLYNVLGGTLNLAQSINSCYSEAQPLLLFH